MTDDEFKSEIAKLSPCIAAAAVQNASDLAALAQRFTKARDLDSALASLQDPTRLSAFENLVACASTLSSQQSAWAGVTQAFAWVGPMVSVLVILGFFAMLWLLLHLPPGAADGSRASNSQTLQSSQIPQIVLASAADASKGTNVQNAQTQQPPSADSSKGNSGQNIQNVLFTLVGALGAAFTQVVNYWLGSSKGSADKTNLLASQAATK